MIRFARRSAGGGRTPTTGTSRTCSCTTMTASTDRSFRRSRAGICFRSRPGSISSRHGARAPRNGGRRHR
jgi:hypothetical protein